MILTDLADAINMFSHFENLHFWPVLSYSDSNVF